MRVPSRRLPGTTIRAVIAAAVAATLTLGTAQVPAGATPGYTPTGTAGVTAAPPSPPASIYPTVGTGTSFIDHEDKLAGLNDPEWFESNVPFVDLPDTEIEDVYYYRWRVWKEHLRYTNPDNGWILTEFLDCCGYAAPYQAINAAAGHQIDEGRWVRDQSYLDDYEQFWLTGPGQISPAQNPEASNWAHQYSFWGVSAVFDRAKVTGNTERLKSLQQDLVTFYRDWDNQFDAELGLYWQTPEYDAKEYSPASYVTDRTYQGRHTFRPSINAYQYGDALAIIEVATLNGDTATAAEYTQRAADLKAAVNEHLWDPTRKFFYDIVDYQNPNHERLADRLDVGFAPFKFGLADADQAVALEQLFDPEGFAAPFGPTTTERRSQYFYEHAAEGCCKWDGPSWPFSTAITLDGVGELLQSGAAQTSVDKQDFADLLRTYALTQYKNGKPYVAEAHDPDTADWIYDGNNHSEDYLHSSYTDLVISQLLGVQPQLDNTVVISPLAPASWTHFALENVPYHGHNLSVIWDNDGTHYGQGVGFKIYVDGVQVAATSTVGPVTVQVGAAVVPVPATMVNIAANPLKTAFPKPAASNTWGADSVWSAVDGKLWYTEVPENTRWTNYSSPNATDWVAVEFEQPRTVGDVRFYGYDDGGGVKKAASYTVQYLADGTWTDVPDQLKSPAAPVGNGLNRVTFTPVQTKALRVVLTRQAGSFVGISELQAWVPGSRAVTPTIEVGELEAGASGTVTVSATAAGSPVQAVTPTVTATDGWTVTRTGGPAQVDLAGYARQSWTYRVTPAAEVPPGSVATFEARLDWSEPNGNFSRTVSADSSLPFDPTWYPTVALDDTFDTDTGANYETLKPNDGEALPTVVAGAGVLAATGTGRTFGMYAPTVPLTADSLVIVDIDRFAEPSTGQENSITFGLEATAQRYVQGWVNKAGGTAGTDHVNGGNYLGGAPYFGARDFVAGDRLALQLHDGVASVFHLRGDTWTRWGGFTVDPVVGLADLSRIKPFVGFRSDGGTVAISRFQVRTWAPTCSTVPSLCLPSTTALTASRSSQPYHVTDPITFTAAVAGSGTPTGTVTFVANGNVVAERELVDGSATWTLSRTSPVGAKAVIATFHPSAGSEFVGSTSTPLTVNVVKATSTTTLTSTATTQLTNGNPAVVTAKVKLNTGVTPVGSVVFKVNGFVKKTVALSRGVASWKLSGFQVGSKRITATYLPAAPGSYLGSTSRTVTVAVRATSTTTLKSSRATQPIGGAPAVVTARVAMANGVTPAGSVVFTVNGFVKKTVALSRGVASWKLSGFRVGTKKITATYRPANPGFYLPSTSKPVTVVVKK